MTKEKFNSLTRVQKKRAVCRDIIKSIKSRFYIARQSDYIRLEFKNPNEVYGNENAKQHFSEIQQCTVCAIGSALMSVTKFANRLTFDELEGTSCHADSKKQLRLLGTVFTKQEQTMMEYAFERDECGINMARLPEKTITACIRFGGKYKTPSRRMIAICKNIIKHGTFKP